MTFILPYWWIKHSMPLDHLHVLELTRGEVCGEPLLCPLRDAGDAAHAEKRGALCGDLLKDSPLYGLASLRLNCCIRHK